MNRLISAEIPDKRTDPILHDIVKATMIHGPCGKLNPNSPCMVDNKCSKGFPKDYSNSTIISDGYPKYRRRDNGQTVQIARCPVPIDNQYVVPYSPFLSKKYKAHINVEACMSVRSVKYMFKYIYKGHDSASLQVPNSNGDQLNHDEILNFIDTRYVSAPESYWRLSELPLHCQSHTIIRLPVHLPNQQPVFFTQGHHKEAVEKAPTSKTMLTVWFDLNKKNYTAHMYTYNKIPQHFVYSNKQWKPRKRHGDKTIGRLYFVSPKAEEQFSLRLLLHHIPGATSFQDLKTVDNVVLPSFKDTCIKLPLLSDDT